VAVASAGPYALRSRQITTSAPHSSIFYGPAVVETYHEGTNESSPYTLQQRLVLSQLQNATPLSLASLKSVMVLPFG